LYTCVPAIEAKLKADYESFAAKRSSTFNLAYAEGFEAMALTIGHILVEERQALFGDAEPAVSSLVLWHFVEEIEHKTVTYDVLSAFSHNYFWRIGGFLFATFHIMGRTRQAYKLLLVEDGIWYSVRQRLAIYRVLARIFRRLAPRMLPIFKPSYDPREVADPAWALAWREQFASGTERLGKLDTRRIAEPEPAQITT